MAKATEKTADSAAMNALSSRRFAFNSATSVSIDVNFDCMELEFLRKLSSFSSIRACERMTSKSSFDGKSVVIKKWSRECVYWLYETMVKCKILA